MLPDADGASIGLCEVVDKAWDDGAGEVGVEELCSLAVVVAGILFLVPFLRFFVLVVLQLMTRNARKSYRDNKKRPGSGILSGGYDGGRKVELE